MACFEREDVRAAPADQSVCPGSAIERVHPVQALERIVAAHGVDRVVFIGSGMALACAGACNRPAPCKPEIHSRYVGVILVFNGDGPSGPFHPDIVPVIGDRDIAGELGDAGQADSVHAVREIRDRVVACSRAEQEHVRSCAACQRIPARNIASAFERVVAIAPLKQVGAAAAPQAVMPAPAFNRVPARAAVDRIIARAARQAVVVASPDQDFDSIQRVVAGAAGRPARAEIHGYACAGPGIGSGIKAAASVQKVVARASRQRVVPTAPSQGVVACAAIQGVLSRAAIQAVGSLAAVQRVVAGVAEHGVIADAAGQRVPAPAAMELVRACET